jgi:hypothetical protein
VQNQVRGRDPWVAKSQRTKESRNIQSRQQFIQAGQAQRTPFAIWIASLSSLY